MKRLALALTGKVFYHGFCLILISLGLVICSFTRTIIAADELTIPVEQWYLNGEKRFEKNRMKEAINFFEDCIKTKGYDQSRRWMGSGTAGGNIDYDPYYYLTQAYFALQDKVKTKEYYELLKQYDVKFNKLEVALRRKIVKMFLQAVSVDEKFTYCQDLATTKEVDLAIEIMKEHIPELTKFCDVKKLEVIQDWLLTNLDEDMYYKLKKDWIAACPTTPEESYTVYRELWQYNKREGNYDEANEVLAKAFSFRDVESALLDGDQEMLFDYTELQISNGDLERGEELVQKLNEQFPKNKRANEVLGNIAARRNRLPEAIQYFGAALKDSESVDKEMAIRRVLAKLYMNSGDCENAVVNAHLVLTSVSQLDNRITKILEQIVENCPKLAAMPRPKPPVTPVPQPAPESLAATLAKMIKKDKVKDFFSGNQVSLAQYLRGKDLVLIHFWRTDCKPCLEELPEFQKYYETNKDHKVAVMAFTSDVNKESVRSVVRKFELTLDIFFDMGDGLLEELLKNRDIPQTIVFDLKTNKVIDHIKGKYDWTHKPSTKADDT